MSADPDLFAILSPAGRSWAIQYLNSTKSGPVDRQGLERHLRGVARAYAAQGGVSDLTDRIVDSVVRSVTAHYGNMPRRGRAKWTESNCRLYLAIDPLARAHAKRLAQAGKGTVRDREALHAKIRAEIESYRSRPGNAAPDDDHAGLLKRFVAFYGKMKLGRRSRVPEERRRPWATRQERAALDQTVLDIRVGHSAGYIKRQGRARETFPGRSRSGKAPIVRRRPATGDLSVTQVHSLTSFRRVRHDDGTVTETHVGPSRSGVAAALRRVRGELHRAALIEGLTPTARDLLAAVEADLPKSTVSVVRVDDLARRLWSEPRSSHGRSMHRKRLMAALDEVQQARIGVSVRRHNGEVVLIGRGRRPPEDSAKVVAARKPRLLPSSRIPTRDGIWGTSEGQDAISVCRVVASKAADEDIERVSALLGQAHMPVWSLVAWAEPDLRTDTRRWAARVAERGKAIGMDPATEIGLRLVVRLVDVAEREGVAAAWRSVHSTPAYRRRFVGAEGALAASRCSSIHAVLARARAVAAWEDLVQEAVGRKRPGRRHVLATKQHMKSPPVEVPATTLKKRDEPLTQVLPAQPRAAELPKVVLTENALALLGAPARINPLPREITYLNRLFFGRDPVETSRRPHLDTDGRPRLWPSGEPIEEIETDAAEMHQPDPVAAREALRLARQQMPLQMPNLSALDVELGGGIRRSLEAAETVLREFGGAATDLARTIVRKVDGATQSQHAASTLAGWCMREVQTFRRERGAASAEVA